MNENYVPFGPEWEKEMMRFTKSELIGLLRDQLVKALSQPANTVDKGICSNCGRPSGTSPLGSCPTFCS